MPAEELKLYILLCIFLEEEPEPCTVVSKLFLLLQSQTFLVSNCLNLLIGNHGKSRGLNESVFSTVMKTS